MTTEDAKQAATYSICRSAEQDDDGLLLNTFGFDEFPPEVKAWESRVGPHVFYPKTILARFVLGKEIPPATVKETTTT